METAKKYYIRPVPLCKMVRDKSQWTYKVNAGQKVMTGIYVWYIENSEPKILVDAGIEAAQYPPHLTVEPVQSLDSGLKTLGLKVEDIGIVIITHLHFDHALLATRYPRAKFIVQKKELESVQSLEPATGADRQIREMISSLNLEVVDGDKEIIKGVKVMLTPGHSAGGQSVAVDTPKGLAVIAGLCSTRENFDPPPDIKARGDKVIAPGNYLDLQQAYDSVLKIKETADIVLSLHDFEFMGKKRVP